MAKGDDAWNNIFDKRNIIDDVKINGYHYISANDITCIGIQSNTKYEPRLLTKYDSSIDLPRIFKDNGMSILPCGNSGDYIIGNFNVYKTIDDTNYTEKPLIYDDKYDLISDCNFKSETAAIMFALTIGAIDTLSDSDDKFRPVFYGRARTNSFKYKIDLLQNKDMEIDISSTQIEVDAVFENDTDILIIEAKIDQRYDFIIRQLYYPYRWITEKTGKLIKNVLLTTSGSSIYMNVYEFTDLNNYNSINQTIAYRFDLFKQKSKKEILDIINSTDVEIENLKIPFPQGNSIKKFFDTFFIIKKNKMITNKELSEKFKIDERQGAYYNNILWYLGFSQPSGRPRKFKLTKKGHMFIRSNSEKRNEIVIKSLCKHKPFKEMILHYIDDQELDLETIKGCILKSRSELSESTIGRRAQSVKSFCRWVFSLIKGE